MSNHYNTGGSTNADDAAKAIDCLDHPVSRDLASYGALADSLKASGAGLRPAAGLGRGGLRRLARAADADRRAGGGPGAPPILVVGTTNDPATPYAWAVSVAKELDRGVLLTHDGDDHVAYFYSACVASRRADVPRQRGRRLPRGPSAASYGAVPLTQLVKR